MSFVRWRLRCAAYQAEEEEARQKEEEERLAAEERAKAARKPRHFDLDLKTLRVEEAQVQDIDSLESLLTSVRETSHPKRVGNVDDFIYDEGKEEEAEVQALREKLSDMVVVARAKVTQDRIYCSAYHPERNKDLIFFGGEFRQFASV